MVYLAEFAVVGTMELADEILICSDSEEEAQLFALHYASNWGIDLHALRPARRHHIQSAYRQYRMSEPYKQPEQTPTKNMVEVAPNFWA